MRLINIKNVSIIATDETIIHALSLLRKYVSTQIKTLINIATTDIINANNDIVSIIKPFI